MRHGYVEKSDFFGVLEVDIRLALLVERNADARFFSAVSVKVTH